MRDDRGVAVTVCVGGVAAIVGVVVVVVGVFAVMARMSARGAALFGLVLGTGALVGRR